jgi:hypothetical protein
MADVARAVVRRVTKLAIAGVAKRKPASTAAGEQSDRQLSARASRQTGP